MKPFIDIDDYLGYFNWESVDVRAGTASLEINKGAYFARLEMKSEQDRFNNYTIEFILKFQHRNYKEGTPLQREFKIEHHPPGRSRHEKPHVQLHIHGPADKNKVGEIWITLPLESEQEYKRCIEGFFHLLEEVIQGCEPGLEQEMLNIDEIRKLVKERDFLIKKINISLNSNQIEFKDPEGRRIILTSDKVKRLVGKDISLLPFFDIQADKRRYSRT